MNYVFIAIENTDPEALRQDLLNTSDISPASLVVEAGGTSSKFFKEFRKVAELYIWTHKFWYGTYFEKLTYVRLKNSINVPLIFQIKYAEQIRLAISAKRSTIIESSTRDDLNAGFRTSARFFDEERIIKIRPLLEKICWQWNVLISYKNQI